MPLPTSPFRPASRMALSVGLALAALVSTGSAAVAEEEDPNLGQQIAENQAVVEGERVLTAGHVDMGPRFIDGDWIFLVHDDLAKADADAESVWRYPDQTVFNVVDQALLTVPDDSAYDFLGADDGSKVWVVPQTQDSEVVWLGWNTQDPEVMQRIDRGVTMTMTGVQGPGAVTVYLQSGTFGEPQLLWDSRETDDQSIWVDVNTHTHANWVFTEPGVYLLELRVEAELVDGSSVTDTQVLRFAVGSDTAPEKALAAVWKGSGPAADEVQDDTDTEGATAGAPTGDPLVPVLVAAIVVVALGLILGLVVAVRSSRRARQAAFMRDADAPAPDEAEGRKG